MRIVRCLPGAAWGFTHIAVPVYFLDEVRYPASTRLYFRKLLDGKRIEAEATFGQLLEVIPGLLD